MVEGVLKAKEIQGMMEELGMNFGNGDMTLGTDSSAAKSFVARRGVGRMRQMVVKYLWLQEVVRKGFVKMMKARGVENPVDCMSKDLRVETMRGYLEQCGFRMVM